MERDPVAILDKAIKDRGWTQNEAERRLRFPTGAISTWRSRRQTPGALFQLIMYRILGIDPELWMTTDDKVRFEEAQAAAQLPRHGRKQSAQQAA